MSDGLFDVSDVNPETHWCGRELVNGRCPFHEAVRNTEPRKIARADGPATSKAAAKAVSYRTGTQKAIILAEYGKCVDFGLTDEEVAVILGEVEVNKIRKRCSDLRNEGMIERTEMTRTGKSGMENEVCSITTRGIATLSSMKEPNDSAPTAIDRTTPTPDGTYPSHAATRDELVASGIIPVQDCRYCGESNGDHADYCSEWPVHTCHPSGLTYDDTCAACRGERAR